MMENRSFDHFLGWLPGANGRQAGLSYRDLNGKLPEDPSPHDVPGLRLRRPRPFRRRRPPPVRQRPVRRMAQNPRRRQTLFRSATTRPADLPFIANAARTFTTCDHYFAALLGPTYPNRIYMHAAQTDRAGQHDRPISTVPTIWDRLVGRRGERHLLLLRRAVHRALGHQARRHHASRTPSSCSTARPATLPAVSFVDPRFEDEGSGTSGDDHPLGDIRVGERFLADVYEAITSSPAWSKTVFVINFDEWGGFFDHVPPGTAPDVNPANRRRGFRVPALVISPLARRRYVAHGTYDHTSVLKMIEWRWGLKPLTVRDAAARNLAEVLDFQSKPNLSAPRWNVPHVTPTSVPARRPLAHAGVGAAEAAWPPRAGMRRAMKSARRSATRGSSSPDCAAAAVPRCERTSAAAATTWKPPPVGHVFVINLENEGCATTFGAGSPAPYLAKTLRAKGNLLTNYYGIGHNSLDNYIAQISGQGPNPQTQADCQIFTDFVKLPVPAANGQADRPGLRLSRPRSRPSPISSPPRTRRGAATWRTWATRPSRESRTCGHPAIGSQDKTQSRHRGRPVRRAAQPVRLLPLAARLRRLREERRPADRAHQGPLVDRRRPATCPTSPRTCATTATIPLAPTANPAVWPRPTPG